MLILILWRPSWMGEFSLQPPPLLHSRTSFHRSRTEQDVLGFSKPSSFPGNVTLSLQFRNSISGFDLPLVGSWKSPLSGIKFEGNTTCVHSQVMSLIFFGLAAHFCWLKIGDGVQIAGAIVFLFSSCRARL